MYSLLYGRLSSQTRGIKVPERYFLGLVRGRPTSSSRNGSRESHRGRFWHNALRLVLADPRSKRPATIDALCGELLALGSARTQRVGVPDLNPPFHGSNRNTLTPTPRTAGGDESSYYRTTGDRRGLGRAKCCDSAFLPLLGQHFKPTERFPTLPLLELCMKAST